MWWISTWIKEIMYMKCLIYITPVRDAVEFYILSVTPAWDEWMERCRSFSSVVATLPWVCPCQSQNRYPRIFLDKEAPDPQKLQRSGVNPVKGVSVSLFFSKQARQILIPPILGCQIWSRYQTVLLPNFGHSKQTNKNPKPTKKHTWEMWAFLKAEMILS